MNRTQRAVKKACHEAFKYAKKQKRIALSEASAGSYLMLHQEEAVKKLKEAVKDEKGLKSWHRKMVQDYATKPILKEEKTA